MLGEDQDALILEDKQKASDGNQSSEGGTTTQKPNEQEQQNLLDAPENKEIKPLETLEMISPSKDSSDHGAAPDPVFSFSSSYNEFSFQTIRIAPDVNLKIILSDSALSFSVGVRISDSSGYEYSKADLGEHLSTELNYKPPQVSAHRVEQITFQEQGAESASAAPPSPVFTMTEPEPTYAVLNTVTNWGTAAGDVITGGALSLNVIDGLAGNDTIFAGNMGDQIWAGDGIDMVTGGNGDDRIVGAAGNDSLTGANGDDWIWGGLGNDNISGDLGDDFLSGNEGDDLISGGIGSDIIYGGDGADTIYTLDNGLSAVETEIGSINTVYGGTGNDTIYGSTGQDTLNGDDGDDVLISGSRADDSFEDYVMTLNPLVYYRLDETSGTVAVDTAGNLNASYDQFPRLGQSGFNATIDNKAVSLMGIDNQVIYSPDDALFDRTEGTVSTWFNLVNFDNRQVVFAKDGSGSTDGQFYVGVETDGTIAGRVQMNGTSSYFNFDPTAAIGSTIQADQWYMLTMTFGAGGANFYVNDQWVGANALLTRTDSDLGFLLGGTNSSGVSPTSEMYGSLDEAMWLAGELDATGIADLYTAATTAVMDTQSTTTLNGGNGNDILTGGDGIDVLNGGDGLDTLFGGQGADTFIFEAISAFNDVDDIKDFNAEEGDVIDVSDILFGLGVNAGNVSDYIDINISGGDSYYDYVMALNPLVYYRLDETVGTTAVDSAGNLDGTYTGTPSLNQAGYNGAVSNGAASFDGSNDEIVQVSDGALFDTTEGTVSAWFNLADTASNYIVFAKDGNGNVDGQFYVGVNSGGDVYGRFQHSGADDIFAYDTTAALGGSVQSGQWYMLTMTYGAGGANVYINGQLIGSSATLTSTNSDRSFLIGAKNSSSAPDTEFNGTIDEVAWLADEMNATEVANFYTAGLTAVDNGGGLSHGVYVDTTGTGSFNAGNMIAGFNDIDGWNDEQAMLGDGSLIV